ncbi:hypothetical protein UlMin_001111 [Ulmus minor]
MVKCSKEPNNPTKSCKARGSYLQVHFKGDIVFVIHKLPLNKDKRYLEDVLAHKQAISLWYGAGRTTQAKNHHSNGQGRWPVKSASFILDLLNNAESNAEPVIKEDEIINIPTYRSARSTVHSAPRARVIL